MEVTPTAVFNSGVVSGKLTLYVNYYGQTAMGQVSLQANANVAFNSTKSVPSTGKSIAIDFSTSMIPESEVPSLGFVYEYSDTDPESNIIEAQKVVSNNSTIHGKWIKNNGTVNGQINLLVDANITSRKRAGVVVAYTPDKKIELARFRIIQDAHTATSADPEIINLADPSNSGVYDPANCYVIKTAGRYMIPTFKGNNSTNEGKLDIEGTTVKIYNQKNSTIDGLLANTVTRVTSLSNGTPIPEGVIVLDIKSVGNIVNTLKDGNAVVAVEKDGATLWSWHLWFNSEFEIIGNSVGSQKDQIYPNTNTPMMDRNLGAASAGAPGVYYLWGNKNPYFTAVETSTKVESTAYHGGGNAKNEWTNSKSITDPCPPGYKVPSENVWNTVSPTAPISNHNIINNNFEYRDEIVYPYTSKRSDSYSDTTPSSVSYDLINGTPKNSTREEGEWKTGKWGIPYYDVRIISITTTPYRRYSTFTYTIPTEVSYAYAVGVDGGLEYWDEVVDFSNLTDGSFTITKYGYQDYNQVVEYDGGKISTYDTELSQIQYADGAPTGAYTAVLTHLSSQNKIHVPGYAPYSYNKTQGYQIRCMRIQ